MKKIYILICYISVYMMMFTACEQKPWLDVDNKGAKEPFLDVIAWHPDGNGKMQEANQGKVYLRLDQAGFTLWEYRGAVFVITNIKNTLKWTATPSEDWIKVWRPEQDFFNVYVDSIKYEDWPKYTSDRTGTITIKLNNMESTLQVILCKAGRFSFSGVSNVDGIKTIALGADDRVSPKVTVTLDQTRTLATEQVGWNVDAEDGADWIKWRRNTSQGGSHLGVNDIEFIPDPYFNDGSVPMRSAFIYFNANGAITDSIMIKQDYSSTNTLEVDVTEITFKADDLAYQTLNINTNADVWDAKISADCDWLTINKAGKTVVVTPTALFHGPEESREAVITITAGTALPVTVKVIQKASED